MFYKHFCFIKQNILLILCLYIFTILFILMAYMRNDDAAYGIKESNFYYLMEDCKNSVQNQHGKTKQESEL